ncbi:MAG: hypothetical protein O3B01_32090 [Planctomycetota bacterium]|nr:hypothetical protein [Planctomycetota bacterium]MDA1143223.1 hypothetical protein [Planctomycetota bacterium]
MGSFYTNFEIVRGDSTEVLRVAKELGRSAFVISGKNGDTLLFDADCDEQDVVEIERLGRELSDRLQLPVVASLNHDDDHLLLWLFHSGRVSRYESCLHAAKFGWALSRVFGGILSYPFIAAVLAWPVFIFQMFRHLLLAKVTGLSPLSAGLGYTYLSRGERPPGYTEDDIKRA